ncbi:MAG: HIT domain-containing protein [Helicobacteraceae bacterium]|nr:HIT domain-containing protein [Helicobacteraceae bacterium]
MNYLYSPWREGYHGSKQEGCVFCDIAKHPEHDAENRVLYRNEFCFAVMNLYPYMPGHFMLIPHIHTDSLEALPPEVWQNICLLTQRGVKMLKEFWNAAGVNIGMNLGVCGGAGIAEHIHMHLIPRFRGDTNFITTIGDSRVYGVKFDKVYEKLLTRSLDYFEGRL